MSLNPSIAALRSSSPPVKLYKHRIDVTEGSGTSYGELPADIAMSYKPIAPAPTGSNHTPPGLERHVASLSRGPNDPLTMESQCSNEPDDTASLLDLEVLSTQQATRTKSWSADLITETQL